jgi:amino acid adenylation domain-containing protein
MPRHKSAEAPLFREGSVTSQHPERDRVPLSFAQERLWFLAQLEPDNPAHNRPFAVRLTGSLDVRALGRVLGEVLRRHEVLRATFSSENGRPVQAITPAEPLDLPVVDLGELSSTERKSQARRLAIEEAQRPFDLSQPPLLRATLLRLDSEEHILLLAIHHIAFDGWSASVLTREIAALYEAFSAGEPSPLPELPIQYADFAHWQREWLQGEVLEAQLSYWGERLADAPPLLDLPTDRPRPAIQTYRGACESLTLPPYLVEPLRALSQREGVTLFMTLLGAFQVLLHRYTAQDDIVVGSPVAGRTRIETEGLIGFFINRLVLRTDLSGNPTFGELLGRVREVALGAYAHQDLSFMKLVEELQPERDLSWAPLFQVMFNFENILEKAFETRGLRIEEFEFDSGVAPFDLSLEIVERGEGLLCLLKYNTDLFDAATGARMLRHYQTLLECIVLDPGQRIGALPLLTAAERRDLLRQGNRVCPDHPFVEFAEADLASLLIGRFEQQVERYPHNVAVKTSQYTWTYETLSNAANQITHTLLEWLDGDAQVVALLLEHDAPMIAAVLGVLKAGRAYVPIDPIHPRARIDFTLDDVRAEAIVCDGANAALAREVARDQLPVLNVDDLDGAQIAGNVHCEVPSDAMAYIIYTSGSTGRPKGVVQSQENVLRHIRNYTNALHISADDRLTFLSSYTIDAAVMDTFGALLNGAGAYLYDVRAKGLERLGDWLQEQITIYHSTPTLYRHFMSTLTGGEDFPAIRLVVLGGEEAVKHDVELYKAHFAPDCIMVNGFGLTESTLALQYFIDKETPIKHNSVPIGYPVGDTEVALLNEAGEAVGIYEVGEIVLKSPQVALGYWRRPDATDTTFQPDPEVAGRRVYRTGDLGRYLSDGSIEYIGRRDHQVKLRGFRIELGEIEAVLRGHPAVRETVVVAKEDSPGDPSTSPFDAAQGGLRTGKRLVAYVVPNQGTVPTVSELRQFLREKLPEYMVPAALVMLEALPLTPSGKVDRRALPAPDLGRPVQEMAFVAPQGVLEFRLVQIWEQALDIHPIGVHDNFFDLGGHSLLAVRLFDEIEKESGKRLPLAALFRAPTVRQLADVLRWKGAPGLWSPLVPIQPAGSNPPFFCVHPVSGDVLCFADLARHLGPEQPFYALQARGLDGITPPQDRVEDMAALYVEAIQTVQSEGPYFLGGYCTGGLIAFEMAQQLQAQGHRVAFLVLFQTGIPPKGMRKTTPPAAGARIYRDRVQRLWFRVKRKLVRTRRRVRGALRRAVKGIRTRVRRQAGDTTWRAGKRSHGPAPDGTSPISQARRAGQESLTMLIQRAITNATLRARRSYVPRAYQGKITLFRGARHGAALPARSRAWGELATGGLEAHLIPGDHLTMMREPHVRVFAEKLRDCLLRARSGG